MIDIETERTAWMELYYSLFGLVRNEIRTGADALTRINLIERTLEAHRVLARALEEKVDSGEVF